MRKKLLILAITIVVWGCGGKDKDRDNSDTKQSVIETKTENRYKTGLDNYAADSAYYANFDNIVVIDKNKASDVSIIIDYQTPTMLVSETRHMLSQMNLSNVAYSDRMAGAMSHRGGVLMFILKANSKVDATPSNYQLTIYDPQTGKDITQYLEESPVNLTKGDFNYSSVSMFAIKERVSIPFDIILVNRENNNKYEFRIDNDKR